MTEHRTEDTTYSSDYWNTLDEGRGYHDSTMWTDISHVLAETYLYDFEAHQDLSLQHSYVDVGCAFGYLIRHMRRRGVDSWGLDYSYYCLDGAEPDIAPYLRWMDLRRGNDSFYGQKRFTLLSCFETLEHISEWAAAQAVSHLYNLLVPGGHALLTICVEGQPGASQDPTHVNVRPREYWEHLFDNHGFVAEPEVLDQVMGYWLFHAHRGVFALKRPVPEPMQEACESETKSS